MATKNIVPNANGEGSIGTAAKGWGGAFLTSTATSSTSAGAKLQLISNDGAVMADTHQLGIIEFLGAEDGSGTISLGASIEAVADETFTASENASALVFKTTSGTTVSEVLRLDKDKLATFAGALTVSGTGNSAFSGPVFISHSSGDSLTLTKDTTEPSLRLEGDSNKDFVITVSGELLTFTQNDGSTDILTLDHDTKNATFAGGVAVTGASSLPLSDSSALNAGIQIPTNAQLGFGNGDGSKPDFGFAVQGTSGSAKLNIFCGTGGTDVDAFIDTNGFIHAAALFLGGESSPNTLSDYEEGTWDPVYVGSGGSQSVDNGYYRKIGTLCFITCQITVNSARTSGENSTISGLPFAAATLTNVTNAVSYFDISSSFTGSTIPLGKIVSGNSVITLSRSGGTNMENANNLVAGQTGSIGLSVTYITA